MPGKKAAWLAVTTVAITATPAWAASPDMSEMPTILWWIIGIVACVSAFCAAISGNDKQP